MKGLYFYKLASSYPEDVTKDCKLTVNEIDHNFITLKDSINEVYDKVVSKIKMDNENHELIVELQDGDVFTADMSHFTTDFSVQVDSNNGSILLYHDDTVDKIEGVITKDNILKFITIVTDETLMGGKNEPLGIKTVERTAYFRPVQRLVDKINGEYLPNNKTLKKGDRYLTLEYLNPYGFLYNLNSSKKIAEDAGNGWRVPTKEDWDGMLNAIELCDENRNHHAISCNHMFGKVAGKLLKTNFAWHTMSGDTCNDGCNCDCSCVDIELDIVENEEDEPKKKVCSLGGVDAYSMGLLPSGYGDGCLSMDYFGTRCKYWTNTVVQISNVYTKRFDYDKGGVVQISDSPTAVCSLRLVKDYDGSNYNSVETINGISYRTILMPSTTSKSGYLIWMATNAAFGQNKYNPVEPNGGENLSKVKVYYINEWDGFDWVKKNVVEGDSFVIKDGIDGTKDNEFRLINGEIVNVNALIVKEVINKYDVLIEDINIHLNQVEDKLETEISERINNFNELKNAIDIEILNRQEFDNKLLESLVEETNERIKNETEIINSIAKEKADREEAIAKEKADREEAIAKEKADREEEISELKKAIDDETTARVESDSKLFDDLNEEINTRKKEIDELWVAYDNNFGTF